MTKDLLEFHTPPSLPLLLPLLPLLLPSPPGGSSSTSATAKLGQSELWGNSSLVASNMVAFNASAINSQTFCERISANVSFQE